MASGGLGVGGHIFHLARHVLRIVACDREGEYLIGCSVVNNLLDGDLPLVHRNADRYAVAQGNAAGILIAIVGGYGDGFILLGHIVRQRGKRAAGTNHVIMNVAFIGGPIHSIEILHACRLCNGDCVVQSRAVISHPQTLAQEYFIRATLERRQKRIHCVRIRCALLFPEPVCIRGVVYHLQRVDERCCTQDSAGIRRTRHPGPLMGIQLLGGGHAPFRSRIIQRIDGWDGKHGGIRTGIPEGHSGPNQHGVHQRVNRYAGRHIRINHVIDLPDIPDIGRTVSVIYGGNRLDIRFNIIAAKEITLGLDIECLTEGWRLSRFCSFQIKNRPLNVCTVLICRHNGTLRQAARCSKFKTGIQVIAHDDSGRGDTGVVGYGIEDIRQRSGRSYRMVIGRIRIGSHCLHKCVDFRSVGNVP